MPTTLTYSGPYASANMDETAWRYAVDYFGATDGVGVYGSNVANQFEVFADSTGIQVKVKTGECWVQGAYGYHNAQVTLTISGSIPTAGQARIARVILRNDMVNKRIELDVLPGTNASTGSVAAPALTQNSSVWEVSLAQVLISASVATIAADKVTDERSFARHRGGWQPGDYKYVCYSGAPVGWLACTGQAVSRITYPELFSAIGTAYGAGDGSTTFNVPDKRGEVLAYFDGGASRLAGLTDHNTHLGDDVHTLTEPEIPALSTESVVKTATVNSIKEDPAGPARDFITSVTTGAATVTTGAATAFGLVQPTGGAWLWVAARPV